MIKIGILLILPFLATTSTTFPSNSAHEFHISKCQIDFDEPTEAVQITLHLFLDDLEVAMKEQGADKMFLCSDKEDPKAETYLYRYLKQGFKLKVNEEVVDFEFVGKEQSEDLQAVWCYLEVTNVKFFHSIEVTNSLLMEVFEDQKNIVHIKAPDNKQGYFLFQKGQEHDKVTF